MSDPKKGTGKKPKGSGRRLYTDENPRDTVSIKFATPTDARKTVAKVKKISKESLNRSCVFKEVRISISNQISGACNR